MGLRQASVVAHFTWRFLLVCVLRFLSRPLSYLRPMLLQQLFLQACEAHRALGR